MYKRASEYTFVEGYADKIDLVLDPVFDDLSFNIIWIDRNYCKSRKEFY